MKGVKFGGGQKNRVLVLFEFPSKQLGLNWYEIITIITISENTSFSIVVIIISVTLTQPLHRTRDKNTQKTMLGVFCYYLILREVFFYITDAISDNTVSCWTDTLPLFQAFHNHIWRITAKNVCVSTNIGISFLPNINIGLKTANRSCFNCNTINSLSNLTQHTKTPLTRITVQFTLVYRVYNF